jgi:hypothetical protein
MRTVTRAGCRVRAWVGSPAAGCLAIAALFGTAPAAAQHPAPMASRPLTAAARAQIVEAMRSASQLDTPAKARAAGYRPQFGDVPLQGQHWVNRALVMADSFELDRPPVLMFVDEHGVPTLVGVAYAYQIDQHAAPPDAFDNIPMWHEHPLLSIPGHRLVMTHVWFIPSPFGPFAHDNPVVSFLERDLPVPPAGWLDAETYRGVALAMSLAMPQPPFLPDSANGGRGRFARMARSDSALDALGIERDTVDAMVARLESDQRHDTAPAFRSLSRRLAAYGDTVLGTIKSVPSNPFVRVLWSQLIDEALGNHPVPTQSAGAR